MGKGQELMLQAQELGNVLRQYYRRRHPRLGVQASLRAGDMCVTVFQRAQGPGRQAFCVSYTLTDEQYAAQAGSIAPLLTEITRALNEGIERTWGRFAPVCSVTGDPCECLKGGGCVNL